MKPYFRPHFVLSRNILKELQRIDAICHKISLLNISQINRKKEWEKTEADLISYFRFIEDSPEKELQTYLTALKQQKVWVERHLPVTLGRIKQLHGLLLGRSTPTPFRTRQNAVYNWNLTEIYYMPPKAEQVPFYMKELVHWINHSQLLPCPVVAAIAHFGLNSIHPYSDGNGRTARLLTRWILGFGGYNLGELYCLERFYAKDLARYYDALSIGEVKSFHERVARSDITSWIEYFCEGVASSFELSYKRIKQLK